MALNDISVMESWDLASLSLARGNFSNGESTMTKIFVVENAETEEKAADAAYRLSPAKISDLSGKLCIPKKSATVIERCGETTWKVQVEYGYSTGSSNDAEEDEADDNDVPEVCFQCSATTIHVTKPYSQTCVYRNPLYPQIANPEKIMIGWNGETGPQSEATGVDVQTADCREQYKRILKYSKVRSSSWRRKVASCVGRVNSGTFKGWKAGEVMFLGASYDTPQGGVTQVKVTFDFLIRTNEENAKVCGHNVGDVKGFEYVWAVLCDSRSQSAVTKDIKYIFKSGIVRTTDFSKLGL